MVEFDQIRSPLDFVPRVTYLHQMLLLILILCGYHSVPPATPAPGRLAFGQVETANTRGSMFKQDFLNPKSNFRTLEAKLILVNVLNNSNVDLHLCYIMPVYLGNMDIKKQHIVLNLIRSGRYTSDQAGNVISNIGNEPRVIKPIAHYSGYLSYNLDIGFGEIITVYGQSFSYLAKWLTTYNPCFVIDHTDENKANNHPDNLRCITEKENNKATGNRLGSKIKRVRLPEDVKEAIKHDHSTGISFVKLALKYGTTRQTISKIVGVK